MCLIVKKENFEIKVAEKDIKCFKIMDKVDVSTFRSMYLNFTYKFQNYKEQDFSEAVTNDLENVRKVGFTDDVGFSLYSPDLLCALKKAYRRKKFDEYYCFGYGGFHSYRELSKCDVYGTGFIGVECIIPKGSRYIEGIDATDDKKAYFSEEITIVREINFGNQSIR